MNTTKCALLKRISFLTEELNKANQKIQEYICYAKHTEQECNYSQMMEYKNLLSELIIKFDNHNFENMLDCNKNCFCNEVEQIIEIMRSSIK